MLKSHWLSQPWIKASHCCRKVAIGSADSAHAITLGLETTAIDAR